MATRMDTFMDLFADLRGLHYNYNTYKHSYAQIKAHGGNCATTISACYVEMGRRFDLDLPYLGEVNLDTPLIHSAKLVMQRLGDQLDGHLGQSGRVCL